MKVSKSTVLTERDRKIVNAYMKGASKKDSLTEAGYSHTVVTNNVWTIFSKPAIKNEIKRRQRLAAQRSDVTLDWIVERLKSIANADMADLLKAYEDGAIGIDLANLTPDLKRALTQISVDEYVEGRGPASVKVKRIKISAADKLRALDLLVRHLGLSKEAESKVVVSGSIDLVDRLNAGRARAGLAENPDD